MISEESVSLGSQDRCERSGAGSNQRGEVRGTQLYCSPRSIILYLSSLDCLAVTVSTECTSLFA